MRLQHCVLLAAITVLCPVTKLVAQNVFDDGTLDQRLVLLSSGRTLSSVDKRVQLVSAALDDESPSYNDQTFELVDDDEISSQRVGLRDVFPLFSGDASLENVDPISQEHRPLGLLYFVDYDAFRGIPDGGWQNNGIRTGFNLATRLGTFSDLTGIGLQVGSSVGIYDWGGTDYRMQNQEQVETQGFLTYGLYRKPDDISRITGGIVQDWCFNDNFGVFGKCPTLSQLRGQIGYATSASNEFGLWGTAHVVSSTLNVDYFGPVKWQTVNHLSAYWHHKWYATGPDTWLSVGAPSHDRLSGGGSLGDYLVTAISTCPLSNAVSVVSSITYMHQSGRLGGINAADEAWNFTVGLAIYPRRNARTTTVAGDRWMPLMPVANNGSFLVDTSDHY